MIKFENLKINEFEVLNVSKHRDRFYVLIRIKIEHDYKMLHDHFDVAIDLTESIGFKIYRMSLMSPDLWPYYEKLAYILVQPHETSLRLCNKNDLFSPIKNTDAIYTLQTVYKLV